MQIKNIYRYVEGKLYQYDEIKKIIFERRNDHKVSKLSISNHAHVSDPTAQRAVYEATPIKSVTLCTGTEIKDPEKWVKIYEDTHKAFEGSTIADVMDMKYRKGCNDEKIGIDSYISRKTVQAYKREIVHVAALYAMRENSIPKKFLK